ncbi:GD21322 [Drosophila simulans]|nr:GD21322 [Drosophila simulans]
MCQRQHLKTHRAYAPLSVGNSSARKPKAMHVILLPTLYYLIPMDRVVGNFENKFKHLVKAESKGMALKLVGFYAVGWTLRKLVK